MPLNYFCKRGQFEWCRASWISSVNKMEIMTEHSLEENSTQARKQPAVNLKDTKLSRALIKAEFIYCCKRRCQV